MSPLLTCLSSPELPVKRIATSTLSDIGKHGVEMAQHLADAGGRGKFPPYIGTLQNSLEFMLTTSTSLCSYLNLVELSQNNNSAANNVQAYWRS